MSSTMLPGQAAATSNGQTPSGFVGMYDFRNTLGKGHFSVVKLAQHVISKDMVAVKIIDKATLQADELEHLHHEVRVMKLLRHPHVIRLYQVCNTNTKLYLILELGAGGDLYEHLNKTGKMTEARARNLMYQIVDAVAYCHQHHIAHRDLKPENVVFATDPDGKGPDIVKVTDFGLSNNFTPGEQMKTACGSLCYSCPEVLLGDLYDGPLADIWSLGVILYMMVTGHLPFQEHNDSLTIIKIMDVKYALPEYLSQECGDLIGKLLLKEPQARARMADIKSHPWLRTAQPDRSVAATTAHYENGRPVLTKEQHEAVMATMKKGGFTAAAVHEAFKARTYDYITSTYCLLAEREIRRSGRERQPSPKMTKRTIVPKLPGQRTLNAEAPDGTSTTSPRSPRGLRRTKTVSSSAPRSMNRRSRLTRPPSLTPLNLPSMDSTDGHSSDDDADFEATPTPRRGSVLAKSKHTGTLASPAMHTPAYRRLSVAGTMGEMGLSPRFSRDANFDMLTHSPDGSDEAQTPMRSRGMTIPKFNASEDSPGKLIQQLSISVDDIDDVDSGVPPMSPMDQLADSPPRIQPGLTSSPLHIAETPHAPHVLTQLAEVASDPEESSDDEDTDDEATRGSVCMAIMEEDEDEEA
eukprot:m.124979 g.124979  ORF g.124979 m.124979 type:complete len:636 (+) comp15729_c0_seq1:262-2169(+)